jgi:hypothetical protein
MASMVTHTGAEPPVRQLTLSRIAARISRTDSSTGVSLVPMVSSGLPGTS